PRRRPSRSPARRRQWQAGRGRRPWYSVRTWTVTSWGLLSWTPRRLAAAEPEDDNRVMKRRSDAGRIFDQRQQQLERGPISAALDEDIPVALARNAEYRRQAQSGAGFPFRGVERLEDVRQHVRRDAEARVG